MTVHPPPPLSWSSSLGSAPEALAPSISGVPQGRLFAQSFIPKAETHDEGVTEAFWVNVFRRSKLAFRSEVKDYSQGPSMGFRWPVSPLRSCAHFSRQSLPESQRFLTSQA